MSGRHNLSFFSLKQYVLYSKIIRRYTFIKEDLNGKEA